MYTVFHIKKKGFASKWNLELINQKPAAGTYRVTVEGLGGSWYSKLIFYYRVWEEAFNTKPVWQWSVQELLGWLGVSARWRCECHERVLFHILPLQEKTQVPTRFHQVGKWCCTSVGTQAWSSTSHKHIHKLGTWPAPVCHLSADHAARF